MHKKIICCLLFIISIFACVSAYAAEVTDVRWGLDRFNVLRLVVDLDSPPGYNISFQGQTMLVPRCGFGFAARLQYQLSGADHAGNG